MSLHSKYLNKYNNIVDINIIPDKFFYSLIYLEKTYSSIIDTVSVYKMDETILNKIDDEYKEIAMSFINNYDMVLSVDNLYVKYDNFNNDKEKV